MAIGDGRGTYSYNTLMSMRKVQLINVIRVLESNLISANARIEQQFQNTKDWQPVKHGKWVSALAHAQNYGCYKAVECSQCGNISDSSDYSYCPNCGAKMDKE